MLKLNDKYIKLVNETEKELSAIFSSIDKNTYFSSKKVLDAFHRIYCDQCAAGNCDNCPNEALRGSALWYLTLPVESCKEGQ